MTDARVRRLAGQRSALRDVNDVLRQSLDQLDVMPSAVAFVCECSGLNCDSTIELSPATYDDVRAHTARFIITRGHDLDDVMIVEEAAAYVVVQETVPAESKRSNAP